MSSEKITKALIAQDGTVLIEQPDGSYRRAEGQTDWSRLEEMQDNEIDYSEIPEIDEEFWAKTELESPLPKDRVTIRLDHDVLQWLKSRGRGYQTRINAILRKYMDANR